MSKKRRWTIDEALKSYLGTFTFEERVARRASQEMLCRICEKSLAWTNVVNYTEFVEVVCDACKNRHGNAFAEKAHFLRQTQKGEYIPG